MKLGLGSFSFRWSVGFRDRIPDRPMTAMEVLEVADSHGLKVVQYADNLPLDRLSKTDLGALAEAAGARGIALEVGVAKWEPSLVRQYLDIAKGLNANILRIAFDAADADLPLDELAAQVGEVLPDARNAGVRLAVENHFDYPSERLVRLLDRVGDDALGVCLDVANSICAGEWPMETVALLAPHTINLHLKDYVMEPHPYGVGFRVVGVPLGEGRLDIPAVLDLLPERDMSVILEHWLPMDGTAKDAMEAEHDWVARNVAEARRHVGGAGPDAR